MQPRAITDPRRTATTSSTVSHTAHAMVSAYGRASIPAQVVRGSTAKTTPAATLTDRVESCRPSITTPAAATPTSTALGSRSHISPGGVSSDHPCISR